MTKTKAQKGKAKVKLQLQSIFNPPFSDKVCASVSHIDYYEYDIVFISVRNKYPYHSIVLSSIFSRDYERAELVQTTRTDHDCCVGTNPIRSISIHSSSSRWRDRTEQELWASWLSSVFFCSLEHPKRHTLFF